VGLVPGNAAGETGLSGAGTAGPSAESSSNPRTSRIVWQYGHCGVPGRGARRDLMRGRRSAAMLCGVAGGEAVLAHRLAIGHRHRVEREVKLRGEIKRHPLGPL